MRRSRTAHSEQKTASHYFQKNQHDPSQQLTDFCSFVIKRLQRILRQLQQEMKQQAIKQKLRSQAVKKDLAIKTELNQCLLQINARLLKQNEKLKKKLQKQQIKRQKNKVNFKQEVNFQNQAVTKGIKKTSFKSVQEESNKQIMQIGQNSIKSQCEGNFSSRVYTFCDSNLSAEQSQCEKLSKNFGFEKISPQQ